MWILLSLFNLAAVNAASGTCQVLAIGGMTDRGAYEAGAIMGLIQYLPAGGAAWDVVTGTGVGAINGVFLTQYAKGQEAAAATALNSFWSTFTTNKFYEDWVGGYVTGLFLESGFFNTAPMKKTIAGIFKKSPLRFFGIGSTDLISTAYVYFNSSTASLSSLNTGVLASAADWGFFPYVTYNKMWLTSGAASYSVDVFHGITACQELGFELNQIVIDVVLGAGKSIENIDAKNYKTFQVVRRTFEIFSYEDSKLIIDNAMHDFPEVTFRTVIYPTAKLENPLVPYDFTPQQIADMIKLGQADAQKAVGIKYESS